MKIYVYLPILIFGFLSCSSGDTNQTIDTGLIGEWKMTEAYISAGGPQYWVDVENGEEFVFLENGRFNSNRFLECADGVFSLEKNQLLLQYNCDGFESESENEDGFISYHLEFEANYFVATPTSGPICIEGCSYKYIRK